MCSGTVAWELGRAIMSSMPNKPLPKPDNDTYCEVKFIRNSDGISLHSHMDFANVPEHSRGPGENADPLLYPLRSARSNRPPRVSINADAGRSAQLHGCDSDYEHRRSVIR